MRHLLMVCFAVSFFLVLLPATGLAQDVKSPPVVDYTLRRVVRETDSIVAQSAEPTISLLYYFRDLKKHRFAAPEEWIKSLELIEKTADNQDGGYYAQLCAEIGHRLYDHGYKKESFYFLIKAKKSIDANPPADQRFMYSYHQNLGLAYLYFLRFDDARTQFLIALKFTEEGGVDQIGIYNTLGIINRDQDYQDSSRIYFEKALSIAYKVEHKPWIGVLSGNLGFYYWRKKQYGKARELVTRDCQISQETKQWGSAINALNLLIDMDLHIGKVDAAREKLQQMEGLMKEIGYVTEIYSVYYRSRTAVLEALGQYKEALESYRILARYDDTLSRRSDIENMRKIEFQVNFERKQAEVSLLREKKKRDELKITVLVGLVIVVFFIFLILLNVVRKRRKREKEIALLRHAQVEQELQTAEKEMHKILSNLMEKNQLVEQLTEEIDQFQSLESDQSREEKEKLFDRLQSFTLLTDDDWLEFKKLFEKLNPGFFTRVLSHFPDLTNAEIRLTALVKLNLSNLEMARVLGISPDSVRKTSLRLRKKLNMELHEELVKFILTL